MSKAQAQAEKPFQHTVVGTFEIHGYEVQHVFPLLTKHGQWKTSTTSSGWPDLVCLRDEWLIACEVKGESTVVKDDQIAWLMRFAAAHCPAWIIRPTDDFDLFVDWVRHPLTSPLTFGWEPLAPDHPDYPFTRQRSMT